MKLIAGIFVTLFLIVTNEAQTCTQIQGCDLRIGDRCYAYVDDKLNWNQAENCCVAWGGHLASIHSAADNDILNNIRNQSRCTWIGLSNTANVNEYAWSDGTPNDYNNYYSGPPGSNGEVCFHYLSEDYYWNDNNCNSDTYVDQGGISYPISYICQKIVSEDQFCTPIQGCDVTLNGSCYAHVDDSLNWNQAENCCVAWGGHLASIHSNDTNTILNSIRNQNRFTWIGLSDTANDSVYVWTDGTQYDYENFTSGQPDSLNGESCFHFFNGALTWNDNVCGSDTFYSILTSYICQKFPPSPPVSLTAGYNSPTCSGTVQLAWTPGASDRDIEMYILYLNEVMLASLGPVTSYNHTTTLQRDTEYTYSVVAMSCAGNSTQTVATPISVRSYSLADGGSSPPFFLSYNQSISNLYVDWSLVSPNTSLRDILIEYSLDLYYNHSQSDTTTQLYSNTSTFQQISTDTDYTVVLTPHSFNTDDGVVTNITVCLQITQQCGLAFSGVRMCAFINSDYIPSTSTATSMTTNMSTSMTTNMSTSMTTNMSTSMTTNMSTSMTTNMSTNMTTSMTTSMRTNMSTSMTTNMSTNMTTSMTTSMTTNMSTSMTVNMSTSTTASMTTTMSTSTTTSNTTNMSTSAPTMNTEINCLQNPATAVCATLLDLTYEQIMGMDQFIQIEMSLEMLSNSTTIGTGQIVRGFNENLHAEIFVTNVDSNTNTTFSLYDVSVEINDQSFENNTIVTSAVYASTDYANIASKVITIIASEGLAGNLTMIFSSMNQTEGTTLMCSYYTNNSDWISDGITTEEMESTIECTTNHLTTFAVTRVIKVTIDDTVNCSKPDPKDASFCSILEVIDQISTQQELISTPESQSNNTAVQSLQEVDEYLESILLLFNVTTGVRLEIVQPQQVLVIIGIRQNETISVPVGESVVTANPDSFPDDTVLVVLSTSFNDTRKFTNDSFRIVSDIITIQASNELEGNLTIEFTLGEKLEMDNDESIRQRVLDYDYHCAFLESNGTWSSKGITTQIINSSSIQCITTHITVFALLSTSSICNASIGEIHKSLLQTTSYTLLSVSFLFLIATIIAFLYSWKQVFRIDINILNFNHSIVLSLAIFVSIIGTELASKNPNVCQVTAFFIHFLWSSVFLSSLSITILVFYSIWIVGIKHQARKLSPYLIPISWTISGIWALICLPVGLVDNTYINNNAYNDESECTEPCVLSTDSKLIYAFILPIIVIICVNLCILFLNLGRIRKVFKNSDRNEMEIVRLRKVAFGGLLLVPSLGIQFLLSIPLSFSPLYIKTDKYAYIILQWVSLISTGTIGITHFLLVTYQTPEVRLPKFVRSNRGEKLLSSQTSPSNSRVPPKEPVLLKFNVVRKPKIDCIVIENENIETQV